MRPKQIVALLLICLLLAGACPAMAQAEAPERTESDGYIVKLREDAELPTDAEGDAKSLGFGMYLVDTPADVVALAEVSNVEYVEPNVRLSLFDAVAEPGYQAGDQWYLSGANGLLMEAAWSEGLDGSGVTIAVLDTGLYDQHYDFENAHILKEKGYNATGDGGSYRDVAWHGTGVTGVIAAGVNDYGLVGAAHGADILPIRVFDSSGYGYISYLIEALHYAVEQHADVINMSLGTEILVQAFYDAIMEAVEAGIILVAAAGNDGTAVLNFPAAFPGVVGVGAIDPDGMAASYSQKNGSVWVTAPGTNITTTYSRQSSYTTTRGTSFSTPCVAALAAIAKQYANAHGQSLTPEEFAQLLRLSALDAGDTGYDYSYGFGVVNAPRLLKALKAREVCYELDGGSWPEGAAPETAYVSYYDTDVYLTEQIPVKDGWFFGGWYDDAACTGERITHFVPVEGEVERTYYARWIENVTTIASVTLDDRAAELGNDGKTWTVYYPAGTDLPDVETAEVEIHCAYTGSKYSLDRQSSWNEKDGCWDLCVIQRTADESYRVDYRLVADNTSCHMPTLAEGGSDTVRGAAMPASLDGMTPAEPFTARMEDWFADEDEAETLRFFLTEDGQTAENVVGLVLSDGVLTYTPPAAAAGTEVCFTVTVADPHFVGASVDVTVVVAGLPLSTPALTETVREYDALTPTDIAVSFTSYDNALYALCVGGETLGAGADYTVDVGGVITGGGETVPQLDGEPVRTASVTLKKEFLETLPNGETTVELWFDTGRGSDEDPVVQTVVFTVQVVNSCVGGHSWDEGEITLEPDCVTPGERTRQCTVCGETTVEPVEELGHSYVDRVCTVCGAYQYVRRPKPRPTPEPVTPEVQEGPDGSRIETVIGTDGSVTRTAAWGDGKTAVTHISVEGDATITVTAPAGDIVAALTLPAAPVEDASFDDVADDAWYAAEVKQASAYGMFSGTSERDFSPDATMTRGMLLTVLYNLSGKPDYGTDSFIFADVAQPAWYVRAVDWGYTVGITGGTADGVFGPELDVTREQLVTMLFRYARLLGLDNTSRSSIDEFPDGGDVSAYAEDAMKWAVAEGLLSGRAGSGGTFIAPQGTASRAEAAAILCRFVKYLKK